MIVLCCQVINKVPSQFSTLQSHAVTIHLKSVLERPETSSHLKLLVIKNEQIN